MANERANVNSIGVITPVTGTPLPVAGIPDLGDGDTVALVVLVLAEGVETNAGSLVALVADTLNPRSIFCVLSSLST